MIELERTFLLKNIPEGLFSCPNKEMLDVYFPLESNHPKLRLRQQGEVYVITKKMLLSVDNRSEFSEETIHLSFQEFCALSQLPGKKIHKRRYYYSYGELTLEIDVFLDDLLGLVLVDAEFPDVISKKKFVMPEFCLAEITQDRDLAGGMLCGKSYQDIQSLLQQYAYQPIFL